MDILVPTNGSQWGNRAVRAACHLARSDDVLHVLHVVDSRFIQPMVNGLDDALIDAQQLEPDEVLESYCREADEILDECATICTEAGVEFRLHRAIGIPCRVIVERASACDLLVLAKRGFSPRKVSRRTQWILQRVPVPALAVARSEPISHLLFVHDGRPASEELAQVVARVFQEKPLSVRVLCFAPQGEGAERAAELFRQAGFEATVGYPEERSFFSVLLAAQDHDAEAIAVAAPRPRGLRRLLGRGDIVAYVARNVNCAVLALRS